MKLLRFDAQNTTVKQAKRNASVFYNSRKTQTVEEFEYNTNNGVYVFRRFNKIYPNGFIRLGKWK